MAVSKEYLDRLRIELNMACHPKSALSTIREELEDAYSKAVTKTDANLLQKDKDILAAFLDCVGYEFVNGRMRPKAHSGEMIYGENLLRDREIKNVIFEFSDDKGNISVVAYYTGEVLHFRATNNFIQANAPWYMKLPVLEAAFNTQENTFWFMHRPHCLVGKLGKDKKFKAGRIVDLLDEFTEGPEEVDIEDVVKLLDRKFDPGLTAEVLSREIEPEEKYGLPDLFEGLKKLGVL